MSELALSISDSIKSDAISKMDESTIQKILNGVPDVLSEIPFVGTILKVGKAAISGSNYYFSRKVLHFLMGINDIPSKKRYEFLGEISTRGEDEAGDLILSMIDRLDNINKVAILTNLFRARVYEDLTVDDFLRLSSVLDKIPYIDLRSLIEYETPNYQSGITEILYTSGAIRIDSIGGMDSEKNGNDQYILTDLGVKLLRFGLNLNIDSTPSSPGIKISNLEWHEGD